MAGHVRRGGESSTHGQDLHHERVAWGEGWAL